MNSPETLLLIDGHALAYRYYFALEMTGMKTPENKPTWAVFGFFKCIFDLLEEKKSQSRPDSGYFRRRKTNVPYGNV